jgi:hypothetical protein
MIVIIKTGENTHTPKGDAWKRYIDICLKPPNIIHIMEIIKENMDWKNEGEDNRYDILLL